MGLGRVGGTKCQNTGQIELMRADNMLSTSPSPWALAMGATEPVRMWLQVEMKKYMFLKCISVSVDQTLNCGHIERSHDCRVWTYAASFSCNMDNTSKMSWLSIIHTLPLKCLHTAIWFLIWGKGEGLCNWCILPGIAIINILRYNICVWKNFPTCQTLSTCQKPGL